MKLLLDQNRSFKVCRSLDDLFPGTTHVRIVGLADASDRTVWEYAKINGFVLTSLDSDFAEMAALLGPPPKVIWLRCGNQPTSALVSLLRNQAATIANLEVDAAAACLELY